MSKWTKRDQYKKVYAFVGPRATKLLFIGFGAGLLVFFAELAFSFVLQMFLVIMNIAPAAQIKFPSWVPVNNMYWFLAFVSGVIFFRGFTQWLNSYVISASFEVQRDNFRYRLSEWVLRAETVSSGELLTLYHEGIDSVCNVLMNLQTMSVFISTTFLTWIFLFKMSARLTLVATFFLGVIGLVAKFLDKKTSNQGRIITQQLEHVNRMLVNNIKNLLLVKIYGTQDKERVTIKGKLNFVLDQVLRYQKGLYFKNVLPQVFGIILICALSVVGSKRGWIESSLILTYFYLFTRGVQNFAEALKLSSMINFNMPNTIRMAKWWVHNAHDGYFVEKPNTSLSNQSILDPVGTVGWKFNQVDFSYSPDSKKVLHQFSLKVEGGSSLVITGESGSGKSTLISLLLGLQEPTQGSIELTVGTKTFPLQMVKQQLLQSIGYVGSESFLIEGTILENLLYGVNSKPNQEEVLSILKESGCEFVHQLEKGLEHLISEQGQGLSAGQKQRLCFARALLRKPRVLVLDEATANLDLESEKKFINTLINLKNKITIITVTHREALLSIADQRVSFPILKE